MDKHKLAELWAKLETIAPEGNGLILKKLFTFYEGHYLALPYEYKEAATRFFKALEAYIEVLTKNK